MAPRKPKPTASTKPSAQRHAASRRQAAPDQVAATAVLHQADEVARAVQAAAEAIAHLRDLDLIACTVKPAGGDWHIEVLIDRMPGRGGITLDECAQVSRALSAQFDAPPPLLANYELDVGSPGTERPLRHVGDMRRFVGTNAKLTVDVDGAREVITGELLAVHGPDGAEVVDVRTAKANPKKAVTGVRSLPVHTITAAQLAPTFDQWLAIGKRLAAECPLVQDDPDLDHDADCSADPA